MQHQVNRAVVIALELNGAAIHFNGRLYIALEQLLYAFNHIVVVRANGFNAFNHTQWSSINTYDDREINDQSQFGWVTGARPGRRMQIDMRLVF